MASGLGWLLANEVYSGSGIGKDVLVPFPVGP